MAISIHWGTRVITVPQSDLLQVQSTPIEVYELNLDDFRRALNDLEDDPLGMPHPDTHIYVPPKTVAGVTLARVVEIINGYTITFSPDASYGVNIVGGNSNVADVVNPNNVSVRSANSAGLQDAQSLQAASFDGHVTVDVVGGVSGTTFPRGTQQTPVDNMVDAKAIAQARGISRFLIVNDLTLDGGIGLADGFVFYAERNGVLVTIDDTADVTNCSFENIGVTGTLDSNNRFFRCEVANAFSLQASLTECGLVGTLELGGGLTELVSCHSGVAGGGPSQYPTIDLGTSGNSLLVRDYHGGLALENNSDPAFTSSLDFSSGRLLIGSDVTAGSITVRGICEVTDDSTATVDDRTLTDLAVFAQKILRNRRETNPVTGKQTIYDDDNTTVLVEGDLWEDIAATQRYRGQGADRADRMV